MMSDKPIKCDGCRYHGVVIEHLNGFQDHDEWRSCDYPLPYYSVPKAVPTGIEHKCKVYEKGDK